MFRWIGDAYDAIQLCATLGTEWSEAEGEEAGEGIDRFSVAVRQQAATTAFVKQLEKPCRRARATIWEGP